MKWCGGEELDSCSAERPVALPVCVIIVSSSHSSPVFNCHQLIHIHTGVKPFAGDKLRYMANLHRKYAFVLIWCNNCSLQDHLSRDPLVTYGKVDTSSQHTSVIATFNVLKYHLNEPLLFLPLADSQYSSMKC